MVGGGISTGAVVVGFSHFSVRCACVCTCNSCWDSMVGIGPTAAGMGAVMRIIIGYRGCFETVGNVSLINYTEATLAKDLAQTDAVGVQLEYLVGQGVVTLVQKALNPLLLILDQDVPLCEELGFREDPFRGLPANFCSVPCVAVTIILGSSAATLHGTSSISIRISISTNIQTLWRGGRCHLDGHYVILERRLSCFLSGHFGRQCFATVWAYSLCVKL
mmetsp:Transcript_6811/g.8483  ORF Transcript_6811/g.8483 Transcript_6811/m.8483 type:complete len:219 (-) Transcript_6811:117-773(-)